MKLKPVGLVLTKSVEALSENSEQLGVTQIVDILWDPKKWRSDYNAVRVINFGFEIVFHRDDGTSHELCCGGANWRSIKGVDFHASGDHDISFCRGRKIKSKEDLADMIWTLRDTPVEVVRR
jgi:hypothetical protein